MSVVVDGVVRDLGKAYADGTPRLEIHVPMGQADGLPYRTGERVAVGLHVAGVEYLGGLRATSNNKYAWISPDISAAGGERLTLGAVMTAAGFRANDAVQLSVDELTLTVQRVTFSQVSQDS